MATKYATGKTPPLSENDFRVESYGSIFLLQPLTPAANEWVAQHIPDDAQRWGGAIVVEHRFIMDIVVGIRGDGLSVR